MTQLTQTFRFLAKNKFYTLINCFGLAIGIAVAMVILLYVQNDINFDKYHRQHAQIYRVESEFRLKGKDDTYALSPIPLGEMMQAEFPEILSYTRFRTMGRQLFKVGDKMIYQDKLFFADSSVFQVFTHEFIRGNPKTALIERNSIVLTASTARKLFGNQDPLGQILNTENVSYTVTGIIKDLPDNLHLKFEGLVSMTGQAQLNEQQKIRRLWNVGLYTYVLLPKGYDIEQLNAKFPVFFEKYMAPTAIQLKLEDSYLKPKFVLLSDVHFNSKALFDLPTGSRAYTRSFTIVGILILLLASINYMNLATARAGHRSKEIGVKKVLGSPKSRIRQQFLTESLIITGFSFLLALLIVEVMIRTGTLFDLTGKHLTLAFGSNPVLLTGTVLLIIGLGLLSGIYPAFYLSSISVLTAIKSSVKSGPGSLFLRKFLVGFQFFISMSVVIATLLMTRQIEFIRNTDLGFNKDNVVIIQTNDPGNRNRMPQTKAELLENPDILGVTAAFGINGQGNIGSNLLGAGRRVLQIEMEDSTITQDTYNMLNVGDGFIETMGIELVAGRDFNEDMPSDLRNGILVNETIVKQMGWTNPIGKLVSLMNVPNPTRVIGVVKGFNAHSLHQEITPTTISRFQIPETNRFALPAFVIRVRAGKLREALAFLEEKFRDLDPNHPFEFQLLDQKAESLYRADRQQSILLGYLSVICIIISCMGLLGLSSFNTANRIKEIGVRRVLGASVLQLVYMLFKDILLLILSGFVLAAPLAYWFVDHWLISFAYRMNVSEAILTVSGFTVSGTIVLSFIIVSLHSVRASQQNPILVLGGD